MGRIPSVMVSLAACAAAALVGCQFHASGDLLRFSASSSEEAASGSDTVASNTEASSERGATGSGSVVGDSEEVPVAKIPPPVVKSPRPGGTLLVGRTNRIELAPYAGVDRIECALYRGGKHLTEVKTDKGQTQVCEMSALNLDMLGDADLVVRGRVYNEDTTEVSWGPPTRQKVTLAVATPKPGPTPEWNGHYKARTSASFYTDDLTIRNGTLTATLKSKDYDTGDADQSIFTFTPFQLKVDTDGTIVPQQVALTLTQRPEHSSTVADQYLAATKMIWISGSAHFRFEGAHFASLSFKGPHVNVRDDSGHTEDIDWDVNVEYYRDDVQWAPVKWGSGSGGDSSRGGGRSNNDACEKACFHEEATCRGSRGDCLKMRQACVKGCR